MVVAFCVHFLVLHKGEFPEHSLCYVLSCRATLCTGAKQIEFGFINFFCFVPVFQVEYSPDTLPRANYAKESCACHGLYW